MQPWHIVFLYAVCYLVAAIASHYLTLNEPAFIRLEMRDLVHRAIDSVIIMTITIVVPELRRSLAVLFAAPASRIATKDIAIAIALMFTWGYGMYRVALCFPLVHLDPDAYYSRLLFTELGTFEPKYLLFLVGTTFTAPLAEELVFRGYLLNLWAARWGILPGVLISSAAFGLFHGTSAPFAFPMGILFALVYVKYDSLWPGIALHSLYNFLAFRWITGPLFYQKDKVSAVDITNWIPEAILAVAFIPLAIGFWRRFRPVAS